LRLPEPVTWMLSFGARNVYTLRFDGEQWSSQPADAPDADVRIETTPQTWASFVLSSSPEERQRLLSSMRVSGGQSRVNDLLAIDWIERQP